MRLTFEAHTMEHIFDQMAQVLGEKIHSAPKQSTELNTLKAGLALAQEERAAHLTMLKERDLRIKQLEAHLAAGQDALF